MIMEQHSRLTEDTDAAARAASGLPDDCQGTAARRTEMLLHREAGMATAEYAIATLAAVGFAALLVAVLSSSQIKGLLTSLITTALNFG